MEASLSRLRAVFVLLLLLAPHRIMAEPAEVVFHTDPEGAQIFLETSGNRGGDYIGVSGAPVLLDLSRFRDAGSFDVRFEKAGHRPETRNIKSHFFSTRNHYPTEGAVRLQPDNLWVAFNDAVRRTPPLVPGAILLVVLLVGGVGATWRRFRKGDQAEEALAGKERQIRQLMERIVAATESGRRSVANDLHDGLLQYLVAAEMHLVAYGDDLPEGDDSAEDFSKARHRLRSAVEEGRRLIRNLRPANLDSLGLGRALDRLVGEMAAEHEWEIEVHLDLPEWVPPACEITLYRITQEALNNIRKHARAARVSVALVADGDMLELVVRDWGCGFDTAERLGKGVGTQTMTERAELAGGRLEIESQPGKGTTVRAHVPVASREKAAT